MIQYIGGGVYVIDIFILKLCPLELLVHVINTLPSVSNDAFVHVCM